MKMSPRPRKRVHQKLKPSQHQPTQAEVEDEKENKNSKVGYKQGKGSEVSNKVHFRGESAKISPLSTPKVKLKSAGFWSKKLQDLEASDTKNKRCGLYEFNGTDESESSYRTRRKPRQKGRLQKRKQKIVGKKPIELGKKPKEIYNQALGREQAIVNNEWRKLSGKGQKFTFCTGTQNLGVTSTPAVNRDNLIDASNFLFLSPIIGEEVKINNSVRDCSPVKPKVVDGDLPTVHFGQETPKVETKLKRISCRRVLRNGKMLNA